MLSENFKQLASKVLYADVSSVVEVTDQRVKDVLSFMLQKPIDFSGFIQSLAGYDDTKIRYSITMEDEGKGYSMSVRNDRDHVRVFTDSTNSNIFACKNQSDCDDLTDIVLTCGFGLEVNSNWHLDVDSGAVTIKQAFNCLWAAAACRQIPTEVYCAQYGLPKYRVTAKLNNGKRSLTLEALEFRKNHVLDNVTEDNLSYEVCCVYQSFLKDKNCTVHIHDTEDIGLFAESVMLLRHKEKFEVITENGITTYVHNFTGGKEPMDLRLVPIDDIHCIAISVNRPGKDTVFEDPWVLCSTSQKNCYHYKRYDYAWDFRKLADSILGNSNKLPDNLVLNLSSYIETVNKSISTTGIVRDIMNIVGRHMSQEQLEALNTEVFNLKSIVNPSKPKDEK